MTTSVAKPRLTSEDWIAAGFRTLASSGPSALKVEPIARELGTTKGSFYWHFKNLSAFQSAMLQLWRTRATEDIIAALEELPPGRARLEALIQTAGESPEEFGGRGAEPAIRDWARYDDEARDCVQMVDARRLAYLEQELSAAGHSDPALARLVYAAHLGLETLSLSKGQPGFAVRPRLFDLLLGQDPSR